MVSSESGIKTSEHSGRISDLISPTRKQDNIFMISQPPYLTPRTLMSGISDYNTQTSTSDQINSDEDIFLSDSGKNTFLKHFFCLFFIDKLLKIS